LKFPRVSQDQDQHQDYFLSSRHLKTKTLVSRTTSLQPTAPKRQLEILHTTKSFTMQIWRWK